MSSSREMGQAFIERDWVKVERIAKSLKNAGSDLRFVNALYEAVRANQLAAVEALCEAHTDLAESYEVVGESPLHLAIRDNNLPILSILVQHGKRYANQHAFNDVYGRSPLKLAVELKKWQAVQQLLVVDTWREEAYRLLNEAVEAEQHELVEALLKAGVPASLKSEEKKDSLLHIAVAKHNHKLISLLLEHDADLSAQNKDGYTPIVYVAKNEDWETVKFIAKSKESLKGSGFYYGRALQLAAKANQLEVVEVLIKDGMKSINPNVNYNNDGSSENTALHEAILNGNAEMIRLLLDYGADLTLQNANGDTPIVLAAEKQQWDLVKMIARHSKTDEKDGMEKGGALIEAEKRNELSTMRVLLEDPNVDINWCEEESENACLHYAIAHQNRDMLQMLLQHHSCDLSEENKGGDTPIVFAAKKGDWDAVKLIASMYEAYQKKGFHYSRAMRLAVKANRLDVAQVVFDACKLGCFPQSKGKETQNSTLHEAVLNRNADMITWLIENGADLAAENADGATPMMLAAKNDDWETVKLIAKSKETFDCSGFGYSAALRRAAMASKVDVVDVLIKADTLAYGDYTLDADKHNRALHEAVLNNPAMIGLLLEAGADFQSKNKNGLTPFALACVEKKWAAVDCLLENDAVVKAVKKDGISADMFRAMIESDRLDVARQLLLQGVVADLEDAEPSLMTAAVEAEKPEAVRFLIESGLVNSEDYPKEVFDIPMLDAMVSAMFDDLQNDENAFKGLKMTIQQITDYQVIAMHESYDQLRLQKSYNKKTLLRAINQFIDAPNEPVNLQSVSQIASSNAVINDAAERLQRYVAMQSQMMAQVNNIRNALLQVREAAARQCWSDHSRLYRMRGKTPSHVKDIVKTIEHLHQNTDWRDVLDMYVAVREKLENIPAEKKQRADSAHFYKMIEKSLDQASRTVELDLIVPLEQADDVYARKQQQHVYSATPTGATYATMFSPKQDARPVEKKEKPHVFKSRMKSSSAKAPAYPSVPTGRLVDVTESISYPPVPAGDPEGEKKAEKRMALA